MIKKEDILKAYSFDASLIENEPVDVIFPKTKEELVEVVKECIKNNQAITLRGSGTSLTGSSTPSKNAVVVSCEKLNKFIIKENTVICEPGVNVSYLNKELLKIGKFYPIEPSSKRVATIGGMVSTNASGLRAHIFGSMKDWVNKIVFIDGNGNIVTETSENFCGSEGILGAILEVHLKTTKPIVDKSYDLLSFDNFDEVVKCVKKIKNNASVVEVIDKVSSEIIGLDKKYNLIVCYTDEKGEFNDVNEIIEKRESLYPHLAQMGNYLIEDPKLELDAMIKLVEFLEKNNIPFFGHIGYGILHPCFNQNNQDLIKKMYEIVLSLGGQISGEHGYGIKKAKYLDQKAREKWMHLKKKYDPKNIFNPGKLIETSNFGKIDLVCSGCGMCKVCPIYQIEKNEVYTPRGKFSAKGVNVFACTLCKKCEIFCPSGVNITDNILRIRELLVSKGFETEKGKKMIKKVRKYGNPFGEDFEEGEWYCC